MQVQPIVRLVAFLILRANSGTPVTTPPGVSKSKIIVLILTSRSHSSIISCTSSTSTQPIIFSISVQPEPITPLTGTTAIEPDLINCGTGPNNISNTSSMSSLANDWNGTDSTFSKYAFAFAGSIKIGEKVLNALERAFINYSSVLGSSGSSCKISPSSGISRLRFSSFGLTELFISTGEIFCGL